jgi:hypothetical protein
MSKIDVPVLERSNIRLWFGMQQNEEVNGGRLSSGLK